MIRGLKQYEIGLVNGGKHFICHMVSGLKKGVEIGSTVFCLTYDRAILLGREIQNENFRSALSKGVCGVLAGTGVEIIGHVVEKVSGIEC